MKTKWSKLALISFTLITLLLIYTILTNVINLLNPATSEAFVRVAKPVVFSALFSLILYVALFVLNIIAFTICKKNPELKGKRLSLIGIVFSLILIGYILLAVLSGPK